jgi:hypothetical protein
MNNSTSNPNCSGTVNFTYSNIEGGMGGTGNIDADPLFWSTPPMGYFFLSQTAAGQSQNSPCVNAGDPTSPLISGSTRSDMVPDAGIVDMGYHWQGYLGDHPEIAELLVEAFESVEESASLALPESADLRLHNHPNPFNPATIITLTLDQAATVDLTVYDMNGRMVAKLHDGNLEAGAHEFLFSGQNLPTSVYVYRAHVAGKVLTGKALLIK